MPIVITINAIIIVIIKITIIIITLPPRILCRSIFFFFHSSFSNSLCRIAIILCHESHKHGVAGDGTGDSDGYGDGSIGSFF